MSANNLQLSVLLRLNDQMSRGLRAAMQGVDRESRTATRSVEGVAQAANRVQPSGIGRLVAAMRQANTEARSTTSSLGGIASVANRIQPLGIQRLTSALRAMQGQANSALSVLRRVSGATLNGGMAVGSGIMAGGYVAKNAIERPMTYDRSLALLSNTANSDMDATGRIANKERLNAGIRNAVNVGGGTPEQALDTLNALVGSNAFGGANESMAQLPILQKVATGTGANGRELAQIMAAAKQTMGIADKDMPAMLSKAIKAGQLGGFELTDMAKWLPAQMTLAGGNGMKGMGGFESLLAANQVSRITAGTSDEAGNNMVNLLTKINSADTSKDFKKLGKDLTGTLVEARRKGQNPLEAFIALVGSISNKDKDFTSLQKKANSATGAEQKATYAAMADIMMQKSIGETVQDRQALMGLLAMIQQIDKYNNLKAKVAAESGQEAETSYQVIGSSLDFKTEQLGNKKAFAAIDALADINGPLASLLDKANTLAEADTVLAKHIYETATAMGVLASAIAGGGLIRLLTGGGGGAGLARMGGMALAGTASIAAGVGGYSLWQMAKHGMTPDNTSMRLDKNISLPQRINEYLNTNTQADKPAKVEVTVDVKNGNITAEVNKANNQQARRN